MLFLHYLDMVFCTLLLKLFCSSSDLLQHRHGLIWSETFTFLIKGDPFLHMMLQHLSRSLTDSAVIVVGVLLFFIYDFGSDKILQWVILLNDLVMIPGFLNRGSVTKSSCLVNYGSFSFTVFWCIYLLSLELRANNFTSRRLSVVPWVILEFVIWLFEITYLLDTEVR